MFRNGISIFCFIEDTQKSYYLIHKSHFKGTLNSIFVRSNPVRGDVYSIQHYVIKCVSDLWQVGGFLRELRFPQPIKLTATIYQWSIVESGVNTIYIT
jgi:hypothetical protein